MRVAGALEEVLGERRGLAGGGRGVGTRYLAPGGGWGGWGLGGTNQEE